MNVVIADIFGIAGRRGELSSLLADAQRTALRRPDCLRYTVSSGLGDPDHYVVVEEWRDEAALDAHFASAAFARFQWELHGLLARPSEVRIHSVSQTHRPIASGPTDPRAVS